MIDRKVFSVAAFFIAVMLGVALWRVSLLPDWTALPRFSPKGVELALGSTRGLFMLPLAMLFALLCSGFQGWCMKNPDAQKLRRWRAYNAFMLAAMGVLFLVLQGMIVFKSFAATSFLTGWDGFRAFLILWGVVLIAISNSAPKLPVMQPRFAFFRLNDAAASRYLRVTARTGVLFGLVFIAAAFAAPQAMLFPIIEIVSAMMVLGTLSLLFLLKRSQSH